MSEYLWTDEDFDEMSWHDNHVHGLRIIEGDYGSGQLILDIGYILEWLKNTDDKYQFRILPSVLEFIEVTNLRIALDYKTPTAALGPFSIHTIERKLETRERYQAQLWSIIVNWPVGEISFEASGFAQRGIREPQITDEQYLSSQEWGNSI